MRPSAGRQGRRPAWRWAPWVCLAALSAALGAESGNAPASLRARETVYRYRPTYRVPPPLEAIQKHLTPGADAFPEEAVAEELSRELTALGQSLRDGHRFSDAVGKLLTPESKGSPFTASHPASANDGALGVERIPVAPASDPSLNRTAFQTAISNFMDPFESVDTAEFLLISIEPDAGGSGQVGTSIRYDLSGRARNGGRVEHVGHWRMRWRRQGQEWKVVEWTATDGLTGRAASPLFTEVTAAAFGANRAFSDQLVSGLDDWIDRIDSAFTPGGMGHHGVSVGDADGDGHDDLYLSQPSGLPNRLFRNNGNGTFTDITEAAGLAVLDSTSQSLFGDVENDGDQDLILVTRSGPLLFTNDGHGRFAHVADAFQLAGPLRGTLTSAAMADYDRDGFLDVYLCAYSFLIGASEDKAGPPAPYHDAQNGPPNILLRNTGKGRFVEVTDAAGLNENNDRFSFAAAWGDYDEDGWPDLLVANDFGRKNLYRNLGRIDGQVRFKDVADSAGVNDHGAGMSAAFVDYDNDGHLDIYTGNMWTAAGLRVTAQPAFMRDAPPAVRDVYRRHARGNSLFRNRGDGTFSDVTMDARAEFGRWAWASDVLDVDSDGWQDLYIVNGMFTRDGAEKGIDVDSFFWRQVTARSPLVRQTGTSYDDAWRATNRLLFRNGEQAGHERNVLLRNDGRGGFDDVSGISGLDLDQDGRSFAVLDYEGDGDPDVVTMAPRSSPQLRLFRNEFMSRPAALAIRLTGTKSNRDAIGARVTVETDLGRFVRVVNAGSGFISQHSRELLFGLGGSARVTKITVVWPSGLVQVLGEHAANTRLRITEGSDTTQAESLEEAASATEVTGTRTRTHASRAIQTGIWLYQPYPAPDFVVRDLAGQEHSLRSLGGRPAVLLFWAAWAPPSLATLQELSKHQAALRRAGIQLLAVAVDDPKDESKVRAAAGTSGLPIVLAGAGLAGRYNLLHRYLFDRREDLRLPTILLLNPRGEVVKVYRETPRATQLVEDAAAADRPEPERLIRSLPFAGRFYSPPGDRNYFQYGLELSEQEYDDAALVAFERASKVDPSAITFFNLGTLYMRRGQPADARAAFERSLALQAGYPDANNSLGVLIARSGDLDGAIARFSAAVDAKPDFADALNNLGYALFQRGDVARAGAMIEKALTLQPDFPEALNNMGILLGSQGDLDRALTYFQKAVDRRSSYGEAANNLALVLAARGENEKAVATLRRLLRQSPDFEPAYVTLARMYLKAGSLKESAQVLEQLLLRNPSHPLGLKLLGEIRTATP